MTRMVLVASWLRPEDVEPALRLLSMYVGCGRMDPQEAEELRKRIVERARYNQAEAERAVTI